ncbi:hypothetical protein GE061_002050 [Apolygus lucorum]|uniref:Endonuclease/exonuclease/phosphatase domain-containing protein n=1 Tax=Apolygus lucorum TaxID=248454 RepID=A0A8S9X413_APOLU|nr:hypothetical protein GE061_002050 [Apolygus lucorum]
MSRGRASGGLLLGIKNTSQVTETFRFESGTEQHYFVGTCGGIRINIVPVYLNCNSWEEDFNGLYEFLRNIKHEDQEYIVIGDTNARTAAKQLVPTEFEIDGQRFTEARRSKDSKSNGRGDSFLQFCEDFSLIIVNGRCSGDPDGEWTYIGSNGASVIDLCCISPDVMMLMDAFSVGCCTFSDHLPLEMKLHCGSTQIDDVLPLLPKQAWREAGREAYRKQLSLMSVEPLNESLPLEAAMTQLTERVVRAAALVGMGRSGHPEGKEPWWDWDCTRERQRSFALLNLFRLSGTSMSRVAYLEQNSRFKKTCEEKSKEYYGSLSLKFANVRDGSEFWSLVSSVSKTGSILSRNEMNDENDDQIIIVNDDGDPERYDDDHLQGNNNPEQGNEEEEHAEPPEPSQMHSTQPRNYGTFLVRCDKGKMLFATNILQ